MKKNNFVKKAMVFGIIILFVGAGNVGAKSLYVNKDLNANSPISAYDIQGPPNYLVYQMTSHPTRYGGVGLTIDTDSEILFVTFEFSGTLDIVDAKTLNKLGTVTAPGASNLAGIVVDQDRQKVYTVNRNTNHLYVYSWDPVNKKLTNDITSFPYYISLPGIYYTGGHGYGLHGIALDEVNDLLYACDVTKTVKIFNTAGWSSAGSFTVSQRAMGIAVDVANGFVYTGNAYPPYGSQYLLSKYDLNTGIESTVNIGSYDNVVGLAVDQDTSLVYITTGNQGSGGSDQIRVYDSNLNFKYATGYIGNPTGLAIPSEKTGIHPPDANPGGPYYGNINEPIQLYGSGTVAKGRIIEAWEWTFDDTPQKSTEQKPKHNWSTPGPHFAELRVKDNKDLWSKPKKCDVYVVEPFTFVHVTDVHIGRNKQSVERFAEVIQAVKKMNDPKPKFMMITGDLVEWNEKEFFYKFKDILFDIDIPFYYLPGNHDRRTTIALGDDNLENYHDCLKDGRIDTYLISPDNYTFEYGGYLFIGLDSGRDFTIDLDLLPEGSGLSNPQINKLENLEDLLKPKIIFMHHPAINDGYANSGDGAPGGNDGCIAFNRWKFINYSFFNNVHMILTGHTHADKIFDVLGQYASDHHTLNTRPLFIQTRSATKEDYGFRRVKVDALGGNPYPSERPSVTEKIIIWADDLTIPILGIYDSQDRYTGVTSAGSTETGIPDSYYIGSQGDDGIILFNTSEEYHLVISIRNESYNPPGNETFNLTIISPGSRTTTSYYNVSIARNTTIYMSINQTTANYTMYIDYDGDNVTDEEKYPDFIETDYAPNATIILPVNDSIYLYGKEIAFNGTGIDLEDGALDNLSLIWTANIDGYIGNGNAFNTTNLSVGTHIVELFVNDSSGQIDVVNITITVIALDLLVDMISFSNPYPVEGENITINSTIYNTGTANATNITVQFYKGNPSNGMQIDVNQTIASLNASENKTVSVIWNTTGYSGDNHIWVVADSSCGIKELDEENNKAYKSIFVSAPNLLHIVQAKTDRVVYLEGEEVLISCLVQNASGNMTANVVAYVEKPDGITGYMTLSEGSTGSYSGTFSNTYISGFYNITIFANRIGFNSDNESLSFKILDTSSPSRVTNLSNITSWTWINWSWDNPGDPDFDHALIYLNGVWKTATSKGYYLAEELTPNTKYEIGIYTVDKVGNINKRWVNQTTATEGNQPPIANFFYSPVAPYVNQIIIFNASISIDLDGYIINWTWNFEGGEYEYGEIVTYSYSAPGEYTVALIVTDDYGLTDTVQKTIVVLLSVVININPDTLNLNSTGKWITCYIELPEGYNIEDINISTILLNDNVSAEDHPTNISDYDNDGIPDLMVKFDREAIQDILEPGENVAITVTGLFDETRFEGIDYIRVI